MPRDDKSHSPGITEAAAAAAAATFVSLLKKLGDDDCVFLFSRMAFKRHLRIPEGVVF